MSDRFEKIAANCRDKGYAIGRSFTQADGSAGHVIISCDFHLAELIGYALQAYLQPGANADRMGLSPEGQSFLKSVESACLIAYSDWQGALVEKRGASQ